MKVKDKINKIEKKTDRPVNKVKVTRKSISSLEQNTERIKKLHNSIVGILVQGLKDAVKIGGLLFEQKEIIPKNEFTQWVKENLPFSIRTAQRYMMLYYYRNSLAKNKVKTITDAYAHIYREPTSDEIVDADDSLKTDDISVKATVELDDIKLPKKKAKGLMKKYCLTKQSIDDLVSGIGFEGTQGRYIKIVVELKSGNVHNKRIGEFVCAAEKYLKPGGKIIFHKR